MSPVRGMKFRVLLDAGCKKRGKAKCRNKMPARLEGDLPNLRTIARRTVPAYILWHFVRGVAVFFARGAGSFSGKLTLPRKTQPGSPGSHSFFRLSQNVPRKYLHS